MNRDAGSSYLLKKKVNFVKKISWTIILLQKGDFLQNDQTFWKKILFQEHVDWFKQTRSVWRTRGLFQEHLDCMTNSWIVSRTRGMFQEQFGSLNLLFGSCLVRIVFFISRKSQKTWINQRTQTTEHTHRARARNRARAHTHTHKSTHTCILHSWTHECFKQGFEGLGLRVRGSGSRL